MQPKRRLLPEAVRGGTEVSRVREIGAKGAVCAKATFKAEPVS